MNYSPRAAALAAVVLSAVSMTGCDDNDRRLGEEIIDPPVLKSENGVLETTFTAAPATITVAGKSFRSNVFNGMYIPPVLQLERGDQLKLHVINRIGKADIEIDGAQNVNMHYHGMAIPPTAPADDVFLDIAPESSFDYEWRVPSDHAQGAHWYHPHVHGLVEPQILSGMSGLLMVDGLIEDHYPVFSDLVRRNLILKDIDLPGAQDGDPKTKTINGIASGVIRMRPGEAQVWTLGNLGADAYFDFEVDGASVYEIGRDGNVLTRPKLVPSSFLTPAARTTVVVIAPADAGQYPIRSLMVDTGPAGDPNPDVQLATLVVEGAPVDSSAVQDHLADDAVNRETIYPTVEEVRALPVTGTRTITFSESADGLSFFINGKAYDLSSDDITVDLGDVEEWTILNTTGERHVFHIHQLDFLVQSVNNNDQDEKGLRDNIDLPYAVDGNPGVVKVKIPFNNPSMVGRFVFHCHIVEHEDGGMMANLVVQAPGVAALGPAMIRTLLPADSGPVDRVLQWAGLIEQPEPRYLLTPMCTNRNLRPPLAIAAATNETRSR